MTQTAGTPRAARGAPHDGAVIGTAATAAVGILADERKTYAETFGGFSLSKFDGTTIIV
jgi:hypothetical protein